MRIYRIVSESIAAVMLAAGLVAAPLSAFSHECSACPSPCCSNDESGCCGASCAEHPFCDECSLFTFQNAIQSGNSLSDFARTLFVKSPLVHTMIQAETCQGAKAVSAVSSNNLPHTPSHITSTVLRI